MLAIHQIHSWLKSTALTREVGKGKAPPICIQLEWGQQPIGGIGLLMLRYSYCYLWSTR